MIGRIYSSSAPSEMSMHSVACVSEMTMSSCSAMIVSLVGPTLISPERVAISTSSPWSLSFL